MPLIYYLALSALLFSLGVFGVLTQRNAINVLISFEIMLNAVNLTLVAFSQFFQLLKGQIFVLFTIGVGAAEVAMALIIIFVIFKTFKTIDLDEIKLMRG
jgi:NADH-quinone oxidoreductase subunit K